MTDGTVTPIRRGQHAYTDTAALNDIHTLLTGDDLGADTLADIAAIVARTSRALVPVRDIETSCTETVLGWPVACVDAGETTIFVRQATGGTGLVVEITTRTDEEKTALAVTLDGRALHPAGPFPAPVV
jgi:hypothetical protein